MNHTGVHLTMEGRKQLDLWIVRIGQGQKGEWTIPVKSDGLFWAKTEWQISSFVKQSNLRQSYFEKFPISYCFLLLLSVVSYTSSVSEHSCHKVGAPGAKQWTRACFVPGVLPSMAVYVIPPRGGVGIGNRIKAHLILDLAKSLSTLYRIHWKTTKATKNWQSSFEDNLHLADLHIFPSVGNRQKAKVLICVFTGGPPKLPEFDEEEVGGAGVLIFVFTCEVQAKMRKSHQRACDSNLPNNALASNFLQTCAHRK